MTRQTHHRVRDHFGQELATNVVIDAAVGPYAARTPVEDVLAGLLARLTALETSTHVIASLTLNAYLLAPGGTIGTGTPIGVLTLAAVRRRTQAATFALDAVLIHGGSFSLAAILRGHATFSLDAWII